MAVEAVAGPSGGQLCFHQRSYSKQQWQLKPFVHVVFPAPKPGHGDGDDKEDDEKAFAFQRAREPTPNIADRWQITGEVDMAGCQRGPPVPYPTRISRGINSASAFVLVSPAIRSSCNGKLHNLLDLHEPLIEP
jgi:hypothetical protein